MSSIADNLNALREQLPAGVTLVAVSKFHPVEAVREAYDAGQRVFGESRAQELVVKTGQLPDDVRWHFIGHLQTNKVRSVLRAGVTMIESVDSEHLLQAIDAEATTQGRMVDVLLEVHVAREATKSGLLPDELRAMLSGGVASRLRSVRLRGIMAMASNVDNDETILAEFRQVRALFDELRAGAMAECDAFDTVSMGMSDDWHLAVQAGSTMVRIGSAIFGARQ